MVRKEYYSGGYAPPDLRQGGDHPGPAIADVARWIEKALFPLLLRDTTEANLHAVMLLARRLSAANPDAMHPGEAWENPRGKVYFPPQIIPWLSWARSLQTSIIPAQHAELVWLLLRSIFARSGSRASGPGAEFEAA